MSDSAFQVLALIAAGIFGTISALCGAALGWKGRTNSVKLANKKKATADVTMLIFSPDLRSARRKLSNGKEKTEPGRVDELVVKGGVDSSPAEAQSINDAFADVMGFLEILTAYSRTGSLEDDIIRHVMGQRLAYWYVNIYERFKGENTEWSFAIKKLGALEIYCDREALAYYRRERSIRAFTVMTSKVKTGFTPSD